MLQRPLSVGSHKYRQLRNLIDFGRLWPGLADLILICGIYHTADARWFKMTLCCQFEFNPPWLCRLLKQTLPLVISSI